MIAPSRIRIVAVIVSLLVVQNSRRKKRSRGKRRSIYSKSEVNQMIDSAVHPLANLHWGFVIVDGALHAINEQDPIESFVKFLRYNAPELLKRIVKEIG
jgi:hypothetical protein